MKNTLSTIRRRQRKPSAKPVKDIPQLTTGEAFDRLSSEEKDRVFDYFDREIPMSESRPLTDAEWETEKKAKKKMGRPKVGQGAKLVAVTIEMGLLKRADAYAKRHGMKRAAEMIAKGLLGVMDKKFR